MNKTISVILPNYNGKSLLKSFLPFTIESLETSELIYEIIVVDDASKDDSVAFLKEFYPSIRLIQSESNGGFSKTCNIGINSAKNDLILLLNTDVKLTSEYLSPLISYFDQEDTFGVMGQIVNVSGIEIAAKIPRFSTFKLKTDQQVYPKEANNSAIPTTFLSGANALIDRKKLQELGGFDEIYSPFYSEDLDLGVRAWKAGWKCYYEHKAVCHHLGSHTTKNHFQRTRIKEIYFRNRMIFHAIHLDRKDLKTWRKRLLFLEVIPKMIIGQFWIYKSYKGLIAHQYQIEQSRKQLKKLMMSNKGRISLSQITADIKSQLVKNELITL